ncbi:flavin reductase family protein [Fusobacterium sp.]|uniref:flavin reductase family protein n=1 Tax=Fusobacterium sp. TaxID=68766 RepID=UPI0029055120|nr:flavin reductase family protein [Fusobacterium sp.]MDU1909596.1 flavin reductase family protein [Fusobacterium sp.]
MKKNLFKGSVILNPVPVVLITSRNSEGKENVFTVAWTGTVCTKPPMLSISIRPERLSYEYIKETMEFTVNLPTRKLTRETDYCGVRSGRTNDKIEEMKFTMVEGTEVKSSYINECPVNIECRVKNIIPLGTHDLFLAEVLCSHIDSKLLDENEKIHFEWANLISYSHGEYFPMPKEAIGSFGYSVAKKKTIEKKAAVKKSATSSIKNKRTGKKKVKK